MSDLIDRQTAIDAIKTWGLLDGLSEGQAIEILADEEKLPSAQPEILACGEGELNAPDTNVGDMISRQAAIEALRECQTYLFDEHDPDKKIELRSAEMAIEELPAAQPDHTADFSKKASISCAHENDLVSRKSAIEAINGMIDRFERILADIRETKGDDSVCGMCEYDGAYIGQSGDWCNECPGFDKDDCFKLSDECRKRWMGDIALPSAQPNHIADIGKKVSISCGRENDVIFREAALEALARMMPRSYTPDGSHPADEEIFRAQEIFADCIEALEILPSVQPEIIRCKDCDWWTKQEDSVQGRCELMQMYPAGGWYCGNARRRTE